MRDIDFDIKEIFAVLAILFIMAIALMQITPSKKKIDTAHKSASFRIIESDSFYHILCIDGLEYFAGILDGSHKIIRILDDEFGKPAKCSLEVTTQ